MTATITTLPAEPAHELRLLTEDDLFAALVARDARVDGRVFYAITSTGIYCRPVCPARKPLRKNVRYFLSPESAERAGYRACRRCHPRAVPRDPQMDLVERASADIDAHADDDCSLRAVAARIGSSPHHLQRTFKAMLGVSPKAYADARRIERFKTSIRAGDDVTTALYDAGYGSSSRLYERADAELGMTPSAYRAGGTGARVRYATAETPLGTLLVAATDRGLCAVRLGDDPAALTDALRAELPAAELTADDGSLAAVVRQVLGLVAGELPRGELPLDVRATAFQRRVWAELQAIPRGETRSYTDVARRIGQPTAARAVAQACASNPVALVVPCHRVTQADGGLGGYRWGVERKAELLRREGEAAGG